MTMDDLPKDEGKASTLATAAYDRIRQEIVGGRLLPGEKLRVDALRDRYEIGGSPLREALARLRAEGLVSQQEQKGFRVSAISADDLIELTRTRCWVNEIALGDAIAHGDAAWEENIVLALHRLKRTPVRLATEPTVNPDWNRLHRAFHIALVAACRSRWMLNFHNMLFDCAERYRNVVAVLSPENRDSVGEHTAITDATIERKFDVALPLLNAHFERTTSLLLKELPDLVDVLKAQA
jgi:GntR family transcriptional regulator, carbon starvation induced regulator